MAYYPDSRFSPPPPPPPPPLVRMSFDNHNNDMDRQEALLAQHNVKSTLFASLALIGLASSGRPACRPASHDVLRSKSAASRWQTPFNLQVCNSDCSSRNQTPSCENLSSYPSNLAAFLSSSDLEFCSVRTSDIPNKAEKLTLGLPFYGEQNCTNDIFVVMTT
eukprot:761590-Hanusia_phi.AAC.1